MKEKDLKNKIVYTQVTETRLFIIFEETYIAFWLPLRETKRFCGDSFNLDLEVPIDTQSTKLLELPKLSKLIGEVREKLSFHSLLVNSNELLILSHFIYLYLVKNQHKIIKIIQEREQR